MTINPFLVAFAGTLLAAGGVFIPKRRLKRYIVFIGVVVSAIATLLGSEKRADFERELRALMTGGDSFCYVETMPDSDGSPDQLRLFAQHQGKYPLYDVSLDIFDKDEFQRLTKEKNVVSMEARFLASKQKDIGTISPKMMVYVGKLQMPPQLDRKAFIVNINARNGYFTQKHTLARVHERWLEAIRVTQEQHGKTSVLYEHTDDGFPVDQLGKPIW